MSDYSKMIGFDTLSGSTRVKINGGLVRLDELSGAQGLRGQTELKDQRARPVPKGQQALRVPQVHRVPQAQPVKMPIRHSSIPNYKQILLSWLTGRVHRSQTAL